MKTLLEGRVEVKGRLRKVTPDAVRKWGKMSAHQMVCHLNDSYLLAMGEREYVDKSNFFSRNVMRHGALRLPLPWPPGVPTIPELDQAAGAGTQPAVFAADCGGLLRVIDRFTARPREFTFVPHPIFARLSEWEWMRWGYLHADHHLRQFGV